MDGTVPLRDSFAAVAGRALPSVDASLHSFPAEFHTALKNDKLTGFLKKPSSKEGKPAFFFSSAETAALSAPLQYALIGKFQLYRPRIEAIRSWLSSQGCSSASVGLLDGRHVLFRLRNQDDYIKLFSINLIRIDGKQMKLLKWRPDYYTNEECPLIHVWIQFPGLMVQYFNQETLFSFASVYGRPLRVDNATFSSSRPSLARVLVEFDVTKSVPDQIWLNDGIIGYRQSVKIESVPAYCSKCLMFGHPLSSCFKAHPGLRPKSRPVAGQLPSAPSGPAIAAPFPDRTVRASPVEHFQPTGPVTLEALKLVQDLEDAGYANPGCNLAEVQKFVADRLNIQITQNQVGNDNSSGLECSPLIPPGVQAHHYADGPINMVSVGDSSVNLVESDGLVNSHHYNDLEFVPNSLKPAEEHAVLFGEALAAATEEWKLPKS